MTTPPAAPDSPGAGPNTQGTGSAHPRSAVRRSRHGAEASAELDAPDHAVPNASQGRQWRPWPSIALRQAIHGRSASRRRATAAHRSRELELEVSGPAAQSAAGSGADFTGPGAGSTGPTRSGAESGAPAAEPGLDLTGDRRPRRQGAEAQPAAKLPPRPEHPPAPAPEPPRRLPDRRPRLRAPFAVNAAAVLIAAAGALLLVVGLRAALDPGRPFPEVALQLQQLKVPPESVLAVVRVADAAVAVVTFGLYIFLATLVREGRNWARVCCCLLITASLFFGIRDNLSQQVGAALLAGTGLALTFLPRAARYFAQRRSGPQR
ncbi:hypothetical protein [Arthrobacter luteolus]|uniref:hypothetical protein n=1 Tax=Arthrobacter luteolus TaxID=98672 RepID=UPI0008321B95|nr:hypothetical protein [Arthrobacter luteolus]